MKIKKPKFIELITYIFMFLFPILPSYFKIGGYDSGTILCIVYVMLYSACRVRALVIFRKESLCLLFLMTGLFLCCESILHGEISRFIVFFFQKVLMILCLIDFFVKEKHDVNKGIDILLLAGTLLSIIGVFEFFTKTNIFGFLYNGSIYDMSPELQIRGNFARIETTFGHAITYAIYCSFLCLIAYYMKNMYSNRLLYKISYYLLALNILFTVSRAPIIVFIFCNALVALLLGKKQLKKFLKQVVAVLLIIGILSLIFPSSVGSTFSDIFNIVAAIFSTNSAQRIQGLEATETPFTYRLGLFALIPQILSGKTWLGIGAASANTYRFTVNGYAAASIDNSYINTLLRYGLLGVIATYIPYFLSMFYAIKVHLKKHKGLYAVFGIIIFCYLLNIASVAQMTEEKVFYVLISLLLAYDLRIRRTEAYGEK